MMVETLGSAAKVTVLQVSCEGCSEQAYLLVKRWAEPTLYSDIDEVVKDLRAKARYEYGQAEQPRIHRQTRELHNQAGASYEDFARKLEGVYKS